MSLELLIDRFCPVFFRKHIDRVQRSKIGSQIASGAFWSLAGSVFSRLFMVIATILVARMLGRSIFGQYSVVLSTVNSFIVFSNFGIGLTATKYIVELRESDKERTGRILGLSYLFTVGLGILMTMLLCAVAPWICNHVMKAPQLVSELRLGLLFLIVASVNGAQSGVMVGFQGFRVAAMANCIAGLFMIPLRAGGAYLGGLNGSLIGFGLSLVVLLVVNRIFILKITRQYNIKISYRNAFQELPILWKFSIPAVLGGILVTPVFWLCYLMLTRSPNGFEEVAVLDAARQFQLMILFIPGTIAQVILPLLVQANSANQKSQYTKTIKYNMLLNIVVALVVALPLMILSPYVMGFYGEGFSDGTMTLCILAVTAIIIAANNVVGQIIASQGKMWVGFIFNLMWAVVLLLGCYFAMLLNTGAFGVAVAMLIAYLLHTIWQSGYLLVFLKSYSFFVK
ncbi:MAG: oligosaccharide flippase family protein [Planctomycetaceae bacterium]|jgi:O-antigen/teichoic acid export membrane protein|nr:oligosaccharide flippase family protein [Planctomycetaceae bacterium]